MATPTTNISSTVAAARRLHEQIIIETHKELQVRMGVDVYLENQIHERTHTGPDAGRQLARVLEKAKDGGLLVGVHIYGDTMFNMIQLQQLRNELGEISEASPELRSDIGPLDRIIEVAIRDRGYLWISGD